MATWPHYVISLVISSNDILLSLPIALTYCLILDGPSFQYTKSYSSICWKLASYIVLLRSLLVAILFIGKRSLHHPTAVLISTHQHPICWDITFFDLIPLGFESPLIALQLQADDVFIDLFSSQIGSLRCGKEASLIHTKLEAYETAIWVMRLRLVGRNEYGSLMNKLPWLL